MPTPDPAALDVLDTSFRLLVSGPSPLAVDGRTLGGGLPARLIPLDELRGLLLRRATPFAARDAAVAELLRRARRDRDAWTVGLAGVLVPGLRRVAATLAEDYPGDRADIDAEVLAGLLDAIGRVDPAGERLAAQLLRAAFNCAKRLRRAELWLAARSTPVEPASMAPPALAGHPDLVLARAVAQRVITRDEAELIGMTRLERVSVAAVAAANGYQPGALYLRRGRAEARLVGWLLRGTLPASRRPWRTLPIRLHQPPTPPGGSPHDQPRDRCGAAIQRPSSPPRLPGGRLPDGGGGPRPGDPLQSPKARP
jgi:hypothetical protein